MRMPTTSAPHARCSRGCAEFATTWGGTVRSGARLGDGADASVTIRADASLYAGLFDGAEAATLALDPVRKAYVHLVRGELLVNGQGLRAGDAAMLAGETRITLSHGVRAEVLVFDLCP